MPTFSFLNRSNDSIMSFDMYCIFGHFTKQIGDVVTGPNGQYF